MKMGDATLAAHYPAQWTARGQRPVTAWRFEPVWEWDPGHPYAPPIVAMTTHSRLFLRGAPSAVTSRPEAIVEVMYPRCCGLDIHKKTVMACALTPGDGDGPRKAVRQFGTMTRDLLALSDWLTSLGVTHVAMESTGVYWKPLYNLLEASFHLLLVNAQHIKMVPGHKTDVKDCAWIADLLRHGLLRSSFVPDRPQRELRELVRYRTTLGQERSAEVNRLQKVLEGANIKLASVATDVMGVSAQAMLRELLAGSADTRAMAALAKGRMRAKIPELEQALAGTFGEHQRFLLPHLLAHMEFLEERITQLDEEVARRIAPFEQELERLDAVPGVNRRSAEIALSEAGTDMSRFPTAGHFVSWIGQCPGNNESAGKRRSGKTRKGNKWLRAMLTEAGHAAGRTKASYLGAQYRRFAGRKGRKKAAVAVGHSIGVIIYWLLKDPSRRYSDLGPDYFERRRKEAAVTHHVRKLQDLGFQVTLDPAA